MFQRLVSHNDDLGRLVDKGYAVAFDTNHLVVRDIPYLDADGVLQTGTLVAKLVFIDQDRVRQDDHQVFFAGSVPHGLDGKPISNLGGGDHQITPQRFLPGRSRSAVVLEQTEGHRRIRRFFRQDRELRCHHFRSSH